MCRSRLDHTRPARLASSWSTGKLAVLLCVAVLALGFGRPASAESEAPVPDNSLIIIAPASRGGGWDQTARAMAVAMATLPEAPRGEVHNMAGAGGVMALSRLATSFRGQPRVLMISGLVMVGAIELHRAPYGLDQVTPLARLSGDYVVIVVPVGSSIISLGDLTARLMVDPRSIDIGGGSTGGTDHLLMAMLSRAIGVDPLKLSYVPYAGGGETVEGIAQGAVGVGIGSLSEFGPAIREGRLRALAISSAEPLQGIDIPTFRQQGVEVQLMNWRGVMAPPGLPAAMVQQLELLVERIVSSPAWKAQLEQHQWTDLYLSGPEFTEFLKADQLRVADMMRQLGLME